MIDIVSANHYFQPLRDDESLPVLEHILKDLCRENFRRIDRFIQLALLGSARCTAGHGLRPDCSLYLGSGLGPMGNNIAAQEQLIRDRGIPKPFNFINTLGSSAGFYIARNLGLSGQNFFISRRGASLEAVLSVAGADLTLGIAQQALVGVVEEATLPLAAHRQRQGLPADTPMAEGSHWLLLQSTATGAGSLELKHFAEFAELEGFLISAWHTGDRLCCARSMERGPADVLRHRFPPAVSPGPEQPFHDSLEAAWVTEFAASGNPGKLFLINGNSGRGWLLFHFGA
ncbi:MAG: hypothetical protein WBR15_04060 [Gammaproteobacteria bacterium]